MSRTWVVNLWWTCTVFFAFTTTLRGQDSPVIRPFSIPRDLKSGDKVSILCSVSSGQQPLTFQWTIDGKEAVETPNMRMTTSPDLSVITIASVNENSMGNYTCRVSNSFGSTQHTARLEIPVAPSWEIEPKNVEIASGHNATIDCQAKGFPHPTISWNKNENPFLSTKTDKATLRHNISANGSLLLTNVNKDDGGIYECTASNGVGGALKKTITVAIKDEPNIRAFSFPQDLKVGDRVSVTCSVISGSRPLKFFWKKDGASLPQNSNVQVHMLPDLSVLAIDSVNEHNMGNYTCTVTNEAGSASHNALLTVLAAPTWSREPKDTETSVGSTVTIECQASGYPTPTVHWSRKENPFVPLEPSAFKLTKSDHYKTSPEGNLVITNIQKEDEGMLECTAKNGIGTDLKKAINVIVKDLPQITPFSFPAKLKSGDRVSIFCSVFSGERPLSFQWKRNEVVVKEDENVVVHYHSEHSILTMDPITSESSGNYTCVASNKYGSTTYTAVLEIPVPPMWKQEPKDTEVAAGGNVTILCQAYGFPVPVVTWAKKDNPFNSLEASSETFKKHYKVSTDGRLTISNVQKTDEGLFECTARNGIGNELKKAINLIVKEPPKITPFSFPPNLKAGDRVSVVCAVTSGSRPLNFQWRKNNNTIERSEQITIHSFDGDSLLRIDPINVESTGNYTCIVSNNAGVERHTATLEVPVQPTWKLEPKNVETAIGHNVTIKCQAYGFPEPTIKWSRKENPFGSQEIEYARKIPNFSTNGDLIVINAKKQDEGGYECSATNGIGTGVKKTISIVVKVDDSEFYVYVKTTFSLYVWNTPMATHRVSVALYIATAVVSIVYCQDTPKIAPFSFASGLKIGDVGSVTCAITSGSKPIKFIWKKDDKVLESNEDIEIFIQSEFSVISIKAINELSLANYTCVASNSFGSTSYATRLEVPVPPTWKIEPKDVETVKGKNLTLTCEANGYPIPKVMWSRKANPFSSIQSTTDILHQNEGKLLLVSITKEDEGMYQCIARNEIGSALQKAVTVVVKEAPVIAPFNFPTSVKLGDRVSAVCTVSSGDKPISFIWKKDHNNVEEDFVIKILTHNHISVLAIDPVSPQSAGNYTCVVSNSVGTTSFTAHLDVPIPPTWKKEPHNTEVVAGTNVTIECQAYGSPLPTVLWTRKENPFANQHDAKLYPSLKANFGNLVLTEAAKYDEGAYECVASNKLGEIKKTISVLVKEPPVIKPFSFPNDLKVGDGISVTCSVSAGDKPLTYSWKFGESTIVEEPNIQILTHASLSVLAIDPLAASSRGNYTCIVSNPAGVASFTAALEITAPPIWVEEPQNADVVVGTNVSLQCLAEGYPKPTIRWSRKENPFGSTYSTEHRNSLPKDTLKFVKVNRHDEGLYECTVDNGIGTPLKRTITLTIKGAPVVQPFHFPFDVQIGKKTSVACLIKSGDKPLSFTWLKDGNSIVSVTGILVKTDQEFSVLSIDPVDFTSIGNYTCSVTNANGEDRFTTELKVKVPPRWVTDLHDVEVIRGRSLNVHCEAAGSPIPVVTWHRFSDTGALPLEEEIISSKNGTLSFSVVELHNAGSYLCKADNGIPPILRKVITVIVRVPARFEDKYSTVTTRKGDSAILTCNAVGDQPLSISWKKGSLQLSKGSSSRYEVLETLTSEGLKSELVIRETIRDDGALYVCIAENSYGTDERKVKLSILEVPGRPQNVKTTERWSRSASVSWSVPYSGNSPITQYIVQYWREKGASQRRNEHNVSSLQTSAMIDKLHPGTPYVVNVIAENSVGKGEPSKSVRFHTGEEEPELPPVDVSAEPKGPSTIRVTWKPPPKDSWNGQLKGYYVGYKTHSSTPSMHAYTYRSIDGGGDRNHEYLLRKLFKDTKYSIVVQAYNAAGSGPPCHEVVVSTASGDAPPAPVVSLTGVTSASISLSWVSQKSKSPVTGYTVHYRKGFGSWKESPSIAATDNEYRINTLDSGTFYRVYVTASSQAGRSDPSEPMRVRTDFVKGYKVSSIVNKEGNPAYLQMSVLVPVAACVTSILVAVTAACICVRKLKNSRKKRGLTEDKQSNYGGTIQRYVDVDKTRPLVNNECSMSSLYPAPYATIPMRDDHQSEFAKDGANHEMKTFVQQNHIQGPIPPPRPSSLKKKVDLHLYDSPQ